MTDWLTGTLLATSGLMLIVLLVREPVRRLFGPHVAYALWLLPALRMIMPSFTQTVERVVAPRPTVAFTERAHVATPLPDPTIFELLGGWTTIALSLWLMGAAAMLLIGLRTYVRQRAHILGAGIQVAQLDGIRIIRSEAVTGPLAFGIFDRVIALPFDFDQRFSERERCFALDHELAHHRSGDLVANAIAFVLLCLQWFNPLAWAAHAAFRFDQEAACDARVLDKANAGDRPSYGTTIAKAACGRALLFAGALDRPSTLSRRLTIMTKTTTNRARIWGFFLIGGGMLAALPLTASTAVQYIDKIAPIPAITPVAANVATNPIKPIPPIAPITAAVPIGSAQAATISVGTGDISFIGNDTVRINGVNKRWDQLTPAERARIRAETEKARAQLDQEAAQLPERLADARRQIEKFQSGEFQRDMAEARADVQRSLAELEMHSADLRRHGEDPAKIRAELNRSLAELDAQDADKIAREAIAGLDPDHMTASLAQARRSLDEIDAKLNRLDGK